MDYTLFFDTNALLNLQEQAFKEKFVIAQKTLEEIESIKSSFNKDGEVKYKARKVAHTSAGGTYKILLLQQTQMIYILLTPYLAATVLPE